MTWWGIVLIIFLVQGCVFSIHATCSDAEYLPIFPQKAFRKVGWWVLILYPVYVASIFSLWLMGVAVRLATLHIERKDREEYEEKIKSYQSI